MFLLCAFLVLPMKLCLTGYHYLIIRVRLLLIAYLSGVISL